MPEEPPQLIDHLWRLVETLKIPPWYFGEISFNVRQGKVTSIRLLTEHHPPDAKPPPRAGQAGRSEALKATE